MALVAPMGIDDAGAVKPVRPSRQKPATGKAPKPKPAKKRIGTKKR